MNKTIIIFAVACIVSTAGLAQKTLKPWQEWSKKDAQKILDDSPWSQTQTETDTSEMSFSPTAMGDTRNRESQGATNQATHVKFHIRLFSARPVRQAYVRLLELNQSESSDQAAAEKRHAWANLAANDSIIVTVACESNDQRYLRRVMQSFSSAVTSVLKNSVYLERKDGKRVFLGEYVPPSKDIFGARFIFPRVIDGQPFLAEQSGSLRFHAEYENKAVADAPASRSGQTSNTSSSSSIQPESSFKFKLDMKFNVKDIIYNGELEY